MSGNKLKSWVFILVGLLDLAAALVPGHWSRRADILLGFVGGICVGVGGVLTVLLRGGERGRR